MPLAGRPKKGGVGTERLEIRIRKDLKEALEKIPKGRRTMLVEQWLEPLLKSFDPGKPCDLICKDVAGLMEKLESEASTALKEGRYEDVVAYGYMAKKLRDLASPLAALCGCKIKDGQQEKELGCASR